jgi:hypothetical protein
MSDQKSRESSNKLVITENRFFPFNRIPPSTIASMMMVVVVRTSEHLCVAPSRGSGGAEADVLGEPREN